MIWTFKQERNCCTISVCYSGCEMTPRRDSFARRQPPIQPVLDASFLLMQRSGTHALFVKLTGSHLPALPVLLRSLLYGVRRKKSSINQYFFIDSGNYFLARQKPETPVPPAAPRCPPPGQKRRTNDCKQRAFCIVIFVPVQKLGKRGLEVVIHHTAIPPNSEIFSDILT